MIVFSAREWEGRYWSRDIPNGVETAPFTSAVYLVPDDGSGPPRKVVDAGGRADAPGYSPDGKWIYFQTRTNDHYQILRCREDGSGIENLTAAHTPAGDRYGYKISRDGSRAIFVFHDGQIGRVGIMDPDGTGPRLIAPDIGYHYMADISPDNTRVVFAHTARGYILTLKNLESGELLVLTPGQTECFCPQFTPDGKTIVFTRRDGDIYRVGADGSDLKRLTQANHYITFYLSPDDRHGSSDFPSLSPDGRQIAYIAMKDGLSQVHVMDMDGGNQRQITFRRTACGRATFGPDGKRIAFVSWEGAYTQLFVVPAEGGDPRKLTDVHGAACFLNWKPSP